MTFLDARRDDAAIVFSTEPWTACPASSTGFLASLVSPVDVLPFASDGSLRSWTACQGRRHAVDGRTILLIGHAVHPEVIGTMDQISGPMLLVRSATDAMLVVGVSNSSNSRRLQEFATESGVPNFPPTDSGELPPACVSSAHVIGLAAYASVPESSVNEVITPLRDLGPIELELMDGRRERAISPLPAGLEVIS